jgi:hypothetical protein
MVTGNQDLGQTGKWGAAVFRRCWSEHAPGGAGTAIVRPSVSRSVHLNPLRSTDLSRLLKLRVRFWYFPAWRSRSMMSVHRGEAEIICSFRVFRILTQLRHWRPNLLRCKNAASAAVDCKASG